MGMCSKNPKLYEEFRNDPDAYTDKIRPCAAKVKHFYLIFLYR